MVIVGIDPGLHATGYGVMDATDALRLIAAGDLRPPRHEPLPQRLAFLHEGLTRLISHHRPDAVVLEQIFTHHAHVTTAALMAHARGIACLVAQEHGVPMAEYPSTQVKKSLTGNGHASKQQVARMVGEWLQQDVSAWSIDATDALALAIIHAQAAAHQRRFPFAGAIK